MLTALLIVTQALTAPMGNPLITGTFVNLILVISVMFAGLATGTTVALISPICAKLVGIGPFWALIPSIMLGFAVLVLVWLVIGRKRDKVSCMIALAAAAIAKFLVLYIGVARFTVPIILQLPEPQASIVANAFSLPHLFTAVVGGAIAASVFPILNKALKPHN